MRKGVLHFTLNPSNCGTTKCLVHNRNKAKEHTKYRCIRIVYFSVYFKLVVFSLEKYQQIQYRHPL